jgi:hypothetical protein
MATSEILGLFTTPQQYEQQRQAAMQAQALRMAELTPMQQGQYGIALGAQQLGRAIGGAFGVEDPQLQIISNRQALAGQLDESNPETFMNVARIAAQSGDPQFAIAIADAGRQLQASLATTRKVTAEAEKTEFTLGQEQKLRDELSKLPASATDADVLAVVTKYGSPEKVLAVLQASNDKAMQRQLLESQQTERLSQQKEIAKEKLDAQIQLQKEKLEAQAEQARKDNEAKLERAREANASKAELAKIAAEGRAQQNAITNSIREQTLQLRQQAADEKKQAAERQQQGLVQSFDTALDTLDTLNKHPGKKAAVGFGGSQLSMIPGTDAAGFAAQLETFKAQTFLPQVQALKGMGALSDAEGRKLEASVGALTQSMKLEEFNAQIQKIKADLQRARDRLKSGGSPAQPQGATSIPTIIPGKTIKFSDLP